MEADNANDIAPTLGGYDGIDGRPDLFRDTPVRFCGYTNELGEAFRSFLSSKAVAATYGAAFIYVFADSIHKGRNSFLLSRKRTNLAVHQSVGLSIYALQDCLWFQSFASILIPGLIINRICAATAFGLKAAFRGRFSNAQRTVVTAAGLASIPFIVKPIDHSVHTALDASRRMAGNFLLINVLRLTPEQIRECNVPGSELLLTKPVNEHNKKR